MNNKRIKIWIHKVLVGFSTFLFLTTFVGSATVAFAQDDEVEEEEQSVIKEPRKFKKLSPRAKVTFNLEDADLGDLVKLISNMTGKRFILPSKSKSIKATVIAPTKITVSEAYAVFLSILETNDLTVVPAGKFLKIEAAKGVQGEPISTKVGGSAPNNDEFVTRLYRVKNVSAEDVSKLITRFKTKNGDITTYAPTNMLVITDRGVNVKRLIKLIRIVDVPRSGEQVWIEPIHHGDAAEMVEQLQEIFPIGDDGKGAKKTSRKASKAADDTVGTREGDSRISKIISEERTNSLIIMATEPAYMRVLEMIRVLDVPLEGGGHVHVRYIQNGDATEIASTLQNLIGKKSSSSSRRSKSSSASADPLSDLFEGEIGITAHKPTNALVITASYHDYAALDSVLSELDAPRRQVFIEAVIMELTVDKQTNLGLGFHTGIPNVPTEGSLSILGFNAMKSIGVDQNSLTGLALGMRGPEVQESQQLIGFSIPGFGVMLNAIAKSGDVNILSTPHIIAMDNIQAEISVGRNVPLQTSGIAAGLGSLAGLAGGQAGGLAGLAGLGGTGSVPRQNVGTTIRVTPHVNDANQIRLEIEQEISEAQAPVGTLGVVPVSQRTAKTEIMANDQQTIVIGGMMKDTVVISEDKIPILGDIPLLGMLFRNKEKRTEKVNLLMFLTPYIIRAPADLRSIFERKMRERQDFLDRFFVFNDNDFEPSIDYSRTRGLVSEIINEVDEIEEQRSLSEQARLAPPPDHKPRQPIGAYVEEEAESEDDSESEIIGPDTGEASPAPDDDQDPENFEEEASVQEDGRPVQEDGGAVQQNGNEADTTIFQQNEIDQEN